MATKSKSGTKRVPQNDEQYVTRLGEVLPFKLLPGNVPRIVGKRNAGDKKFLSTNVLV